MNNFYEQQPNPEQPESEYGYYYRPASGSGFATAAFICGIAAIITTVMVTVYPPIIFGSLAVIFATLSKGGAKKVTDRAKTGLICGIAGLVLDITLVVSSVTLVMTNTEYHAQLNQVCEQMYGASFDEMVDAILSGNVAAVPTLPGSTVQDL